MQQERIKTTNSAIAATERLLRYEPDIAFRRRGRTIVEHLDPQPGDRILDAGCGMGFQLALLGRVAQSELHGADISAERLRIAREEEQVSIARLVVADVTRLPYRDESFDKVMMSEVLEHLPDDIAALMEIYRLLKSGGVLAITVPNKAYPFLWDPPNYVRERLGLGHFTKEPWSGIWTDHRRLYSAESLRSAVEQAGFVVADLRRETRYSLPFAHHVVYGLGKFLVERNLVGSKDGVPASRSSFWTQNHKARTPMRVLTEAFTAIDRYNRPHYETGPTVGICLRAVKE